MTLVIPMKSFGAKKMNIDLSIIDIPNMTVLVTSSSMNINFMDDNLGIVAMRYGYESASASIFEVKANRS